MAGAVDSAFHKLKEAVTVHAPAYLQALPVPDSLDGFLTLGIEDVQKLIPILVIIVAIHVFFLYTVFVVLSPSSSKPTKVNPSIKKDSAKVVDTVQPEDLSEKGKAYCRCWRSKTFPYCDGAHAKHNAETGDNVGPLIVKK